MSPDQPNPADRVLLVVGAPITAASYDIIEQCIRTRTSVNGNGLATALGGVPTKFSQSPSLSSRQLGIQPSDCSTMPLATLVTERRYPRLNDKQSALLLLTKCLQAKAGYTLRTTVPTPHVLETFRQESERVLDTLLRVFDVNPVSLTRSTAAQMQMPYAYGGLGIRRNELVAMPAYISSWALTFFILMPISTHFRQILAIALRLPLAEQPMCLQYIGICLDTVREQLHPSDSIYFSLPTSTSWSPEQLGLLHVKLQKKLCMSIDKRLAENLLKSLSPHERILCGARSGGKHGMLVTRIIPSTRQKTLPNWALSHFIRSAFGLDAPVMHAIRAKGITLKCQCGQVFGPTMVHAAFCMKCRPGRNRPHDALVWNLHALLETLPGVSRVQREIVHSDTFPKRVDLSFVLGNGVRVFVDPTFIGELCASNVRDALRKPIGAEGLLDKGVKRKIGEYPVGLENLIPLVMTILTVRTAPEAGHAMDALWTRCVIANGNLGEFDQLPPAARNVIMRKSARWRKAWREVSTVCVVTALAKNALSRIALRLELKGHGSNSALSAMLWGTECAPGQTRDSADSLDTKRWCPAPHLELPSAGFAYSGGSTRCGLPLDV